MSALSSHAMDKVQERVRLMPVQAAQDFLDLRWRAARPMTATDFKRYPQVYYVEGREFRLDVRDGSLYVIVRGVNGCYVTYFRLH